MENLFSGIKNTSESLSYGLECITNMAANIILSLNNSL